MTTKSYLDSTTRMCPPFTPMVGVLPEGEKGDWKVEHFEISDEAATRYNIGAFRRNEMVYPGRFAKLTCRGKTIMSDTPWERMSNYGPLFDHRGRTGQGRVLIGGLGLGMLTLALMEKEWARSVLVVEKEQDVIDLVAPSLKERDPEKKLGICHADIFEFKPEKGEEWDIIWFDIWPDQPNADDYPDMKRLHRRFGRHRAKPHGYMQSWMRETLIAEMRREKYHGLPY